MSKRKLKYFFSVLFTVTILVSMSTSSWAKELKLSVGQSAADLLNKISYPLERSLGIRLAISINGLAQVLKDLDAGKVDAAVGGSDFTDWMALMEKEGYKIPDKSLYKQWVIGKDVVKVLINRDVTVTALSKAQLASIFTGKAKNWSEVGGEDKPIVVILASQLPATQALFQKQIMDGAEYTKEAVQVTSAEDLKNRVVRNTGAVGFGALSQVDHLVNAPSGPEIGRPITLITRGEPSETVQTLLNYIKGDGQKYIAK
jgi:phosphate transport system substrate-binding protein